jgi:hypothetical protein
MFREFSILVLSALALLAVPLIAQTTTSTATDLDLLRSREDAVQLTIAPSPYLMADNRAGSLVTAWSVNASVDSIASYTSNQDRYWVLSIESFSASDSLAVVKIEEFKFGSSVTLNVYRGNIDWDSRPAAHSEANIGSTPLGLNITVPAVATVRDLSVKERSTWRWYLYFTQIKKELASQDGAQAFYSVPTIDSLTIAGQDTLASGLMGDTLYCTAVSGEYGYTTVFLESDSNMVGILGYQVRMRGSDWATPMDSLIGFWTAVNPAYVNPGAPCA